MSATDAIPKVHKRLWGQHDCTLDERGRLFIPADFRTILGLAEGSEVRVSRHINLPCVVVFHPEAFETLLDHAERSGTKEGKAIVRVVGGSARTMAVDKAGRISIPGPYRDLASLNGQCFVVGQDQRLEVWDQATWNARFGPDAYADMDFDNLMP